jgi:hypothetical protein
LGTPPVRYPAEPAVLRHRVEPWTREQVGQAVAEAVGELGTPEAVERLHQRSGGVARVVVDVPAALRGTGQRYTAAEVDNAGVPVRLADLALSRTAALREEHRWAVWAAAVLEEPRMGHLGHRGHRRVRQRPHRLTAPVDIKHTYRGDLTVVLEAPDGPTGP